MRFSTALRQPTRKRLERLGEVDIVIGIPCFNNEKTIAHVINTVENGLSIHYPSHKSVVLLADGGSVDDSREEADELEDSPWIERIIYIYRGLPGKGSAVRAIFESANLLKAKATLMFDSDLQSITPEWVKQMTDAILIDSVDYVTPNYIRYKYDGTITNNIVYNLTRALYGYRVRQPIGGDFAFSLPLIQKLITKDVWETDVARFGIDIWLTTMAMVYKSKIAQVNLGVKIHDVKDPAEALGPMFRQVVFTLLSLMEENEKIWKKVKGSKPIPVVGNPIIAEPKPFTINVIKLIEDFKIAYSNYGVIWKKILAEDNFAVVSKLFKTEEKDFQFEIEIWVRILYDLAAAFHHWKGNRRLMVSLMTPLYFARVASFVNNTKDMSNEEAEQLVEQQAEMFEKSKDYLIKKWDENIHYYDS